MCRETEGERLLGSTDIVDTLPSVQPPERKGVGARSPKPPNVVLSLKVSTAKSVNLEKPEQQRAVNERESIRPSVLRKSSAQSPRLLPYFPKPGVTTPPPPQSLARHSDLPQKTSTLSPSAAPKSSARNPSPSPVHRAGTCNLGASPSSQGRSVVPRSTSSARNESPAPASKAISSSATSCVTARNPSPALSSRVSARNPSPTPVPRTSARNPSPGPVSRASPRNPSPVSSSRGSARSASPAQSSSKSETRAPPAANSPRLDSNTTVKLQASTRRSASPAAPRKELPRSVSSDNGSAKSSTSELLTSRSAALTLPNLKLPSIKTSHKSGSVEVGMSISSRSLAKSFKNGAVLQCSLDMTPIVKKPTPTELQAQKKERISGYGRKVGTPKAGRVACEGMLPTSPVLIDTRKRCHWVTAQSEAELVHYHDEVWGVPVHDDKLLFELLVLEGAQAEFSRPQILGLRDYFREVLGGFNPAVVANFDEKKITALKLDDILRQPEAKLRGVIENAKHILKIIEEFGSFDKYLWSVVGFKPIVNAPRIFTQIPVKSSKSEALSKDLMRRGFRYVGPTTVYSFMQAAGLVNDHLVTCFRHSECSTTTAQMERTVNSNGGKKAC